jgi:hypothetical protein
MAAPEHSSLPLPDYDHLAAGALGHRIRALTADELADLLHYEVAHANRPAVIAAFRHRLDELAAGSEPSGGSPNPGPEWPGPAQSHSKASPAKTAPPGSAPPHGDPAQPARPKGDRPAP